MKMHVYVLRKAINNLHENLDLSESELLEEEIDGWLLLV